MTEEAKRVVPKELIDSLLAGYKKRSGSKN